MTPFYDKDGITIFCARWEEVWPTLRLKPSDVALCWADPPYGIRASKARGGQNPGNTRGATRKNWAPIIGDDGPFNPAPLLQFPRAILWGANHYSSRLPDSAAWWLWDKRVGAIDGLDQADGEMAWTNLGGVLRIFRHLWSGVCTASEVGMERIHPTQKPVALCEWGFKRAGLKRGDFVFSPYLGSGPEVRAALNLGLRLIGCELVPEYCDAVVKHRTGLARHVEGQAVLF